MADETGDDTTTDGDTSSNDRDDQDAEADDGGVPAGTVELLALLDAQYGDRFDTERRDALRERVGSLRELGETLSEQELENGDEPAFTFAAYRGEE